VSNHPVSEKIPPWLLWQRLSRLEIFESFSEDQRDAFLKAYENEPGIRLRAFKSGDIICRKGEYELDLCFILTGGVDLIDRYGEDDQVFVVALEAGNIYGELGAVGGLPRTLDVIAHTHCEIFYVPRHALKYLEQNNHAREILAQRYRERAVRVTVADIALFEGVSSSCIADLIPKCEILRYELRGIPVVTQGEPGDAFYIVRDGFVQVVRERDDGSRRVVAYLRTGEYFGDMALFQTGCAGRAC
jgi:cAMP-dependent protein kinase regulator